LIYGRPQNFSKGAGGRGTYYLPKTPKKDTIFH